MGYVLSYTCVCKLLSKYPLHYLLKPEVWALRRMNDRELSLSIILGFLLFFARIIELLGLLEL
jgi:hypothetical protein